MWVLASEEQRKFSGCVEAPPRSSSHLITRLFHQNRLFAPPPTLLHPSHRTRQHRVAKLTVGAEVVDQDDLVNEGRRTSHQDTEREQRGDGE